MSVCSEKKLGARTSPSYHRVREWLLHHIDEHKLKVGDRIPSERALSNLLGLSRPTIARAMWELVDQGVLTREQGNGTFINQIADLHTTTRSTTLGMYMPFIREDATGEFVADLTTSRLSELFRRENVSAEIMHGVISVLKVSGCRLVVHHINSVAEEASALESLEKEGLSGAIVLPVVRSTSVKNYRRLLGKIPPVVLVDRYFPDVPLDRVVTDNYHGAKDGVAYLISKGHRRIAFFTPFLEVTSAMDREAGYRAALEDASIPYDPDIVCGPQIGRHYSLCYEYALKHCISLPEPVTAVFGMNDDMVWGAILAAGKLGFSVPKDIEVAGFFDSAVPQGIQASFTRVVQDRFKIGQLAAQLLLERINGEAPAEPRHILVSPHLLPVASG